MGLYCNVTGKWGYLYRAYHVRVVPADYHQMGQYINNIVEQDHRFIQKITKHLKGVHAFHSADATLYVSESSVKLGQHTPSDHQTIFEQFYGLAA